MATEINGRTASDVLLDVVRNIQEIVRCEVGLAKAELGKEATKLKAAGILLAGATVCGFFASFFLLIAVVSVLSGLIPIWAAALTVAIVTGLAAAAFAHAGRKRLRQINAVPGQTVENIKETLRWTKQHTN